jgi:hypothetical protein
MNAQMEHARKDKQAHDARMLALHDYVYQQLDTPRKSEILAHAQRRIGLWKKDKLCSDYYIRFWSRVVASGDGGVFKSMVLDASKRKTIGMMQNTPFSFLMREQR